KQADELIAGRERYGVAVQLSTPESQVWMSPGGREPSFSWFSIRRVPLAEVRPMRPWRLKVPVLVSPEAVSVMLKVRFLFTKIVSSTSTLLWFDASPPPPG